VQLALADYLTAGGYEPHLRRLRRTFESSIERFSFEIASRLPAGTRISRPAGGFLLWVQLPGDVDTVRLQRLAASEGLSIAPGPAFSASGAYTRYLRINAGYAWSEQAARALDLLRSLIDR
jgi:DNA-binding transcriptional MocR family regulator